MGREMAETVENKRTPKGEITRQRILACALRLFGSKGYEQTTMRDIALVPRFCAGYAETASTDLLASSCLAGNGSPGGSAWSITG